MIFSENGAEIILPLLISICLHLQAGTDSTSLLSSVPQKRHTATPLKTMQSSRILLTSFLKKTILRLRVSAWLVHLLWFYLTSPPGSSPALPLPLRLRSGLDRLFSLTNRGLLPPIASLVLARLPTGLGDS